ncbi:TPA: hypothetical protein HA259_04165 [Thermoplasmata archaeon]|nr:hypothetical protein [Thermoplasmata archaeon]
MVDTKYVPPESTSSNLLVVMSRTLPCEVCAVRLWGYLKEPISDLRGQPLQTSAEARGVSKHFLPARFPCFFLNARFMKTMVRSSLTTATSSGTMSRRLNLFSLVLGMLPGIGSSGRER